MNQPPAEHEPAEPAPSNPLALALQRLKGSKLIIALIICGMLGIFAVFATGDEPTPAHKGDAGDKHAQAVAPGPASQTGAGAQPAAAPAPVAVDTKLASDFVSWWSQKSMDFSPATAMGSHVEAMKWMTPEAAQLFQSSFWTPAIQQDILAGRVTAAFQPISVQPEAVNPDGSVVVALNGTLVMQQVGSPPVTSQMLIDFLIRKEQGNCRVCGLANRTAPPAPSVVSQAASMAQQGGGTGMMQPQEQAAPPVRTIGGDY